MMLLIKASDVNDVVNNSNQIGQKVDVLFWCCKVHIIHALQAMFGVRLFRFLVRFEEFYRQSRNMWR